MWTTLRIFQMPDLPSAAGAEPTAPVATPSGTQKTAVPGGTGKKVVKKVVKKVAKKAAKTAAAPKKPRDKNAPSPLQLKIMQKLKSGPMSRADVAKALSGSFIGPGIMGHADKAKVEPGSLLGKGLVKFAAVKSEGGGVTYELSAAGKKYLETAK